MHHAQIGYGPAENAFVCIKWILIWLFSCGLPCVIAMYLPAWPSTDETPQESH